MSRTPQPVAAIATTGLTREFAPGVGAVDIGLEVPAGTVYGFLGPNGAGKSTTIRMLVGMLRPDRGSAQVLGLDPQTHMVQLKQRIGVLTSDQQIPRHHSGRSLLALLGQLRDDPQVPRHGQVLAERFDLDLDRPGHELSLGNRRKIGLVAALAHSPELVIMDEPSNGLDPLLRRELEQLLREIADTGRTVLLSSHSLSEVERVADHVGFIRSGQLVEQTSMRSMVAQAVRRAVVRFDIPPTDEDLRALEHTPTVTHVAEADDRRTVTVAWRGSAGPVLRWAGVRDATSLEARGADLEETFLQMYAKENAA